jgi:hypothetical protein
MNPQLIEVRRPVARGLLLILLFAFGLAACTRSDPGMIDVAKSLVPVGSQVLEVGENTGLAIEVGDYHATLRMDDGGRGRGLVEAIEERAVGWDERYRCTVLDGVTIGYSQNDMKVDVSVLTNEDPVYAYVTISRLGEGSPWPPDC